MRWHSYTAVVYGADGQLRHLYAGSFKSAKRRDADMALTKAAGEFGGFKLYEVYV